MPIAFPFDNHPSRYRRFLGRCLVFVGFTILYVLAGHVGVALAPSEQVASPVWPPAGIALAALLLFGKKLWPTVYIGAFCADLVTVPWTTSLLIAFGSTVGAVTAAQFVRNTIGDRFPLDRSRDVLLFVVAAFFGSMISGIIGSTILVVTMQKAWTSMPYLWLTWWMGDAGGILLMTPFLMSWATLPLNWQPKQYVNLLGFVIVTLLITLFFFGEVMIGPFSISRESSLSFLVVPVLIGGSLWFGIRGASTAALIICGVSLWETVHGYGPLSHQNANEALLTVHLFVAKMSVMSLALAASASERARVAKDREALLSVLKNRATELARANSQLQLFSSAASHDLQEPLRTLILYLQLLERRNSGGFSSEGREFLTLCQKNAQRMQLVVEGVLNYTKGSAQSQELCKTDIQGVANEVLHSLRGIIEASGAEVTVGPLPELVVDRIQMSQLLQNLIGNAIKFRGTEVPKIQISSTRKEGEWLFEVHDNGIGIAPSERDIVFSPFARLHNENEYAGTGIGLALCKHLVENKGGRIWVKSNPHGGSVFCFTLPDGSARAEISEESLTLANSI